MFYRLLPAQKRIMILVSLSILLLLVISIFLRTSNGQLDSCQANCASADRLTGPTRMLETLPHPWSIADFPSQFDGFCKLGCQLFYTETPRNTTCKRLCDYFYRYEVTTGYSDIAEEARLECQDGCDIGLSVCQAGYFCNDGIMSPCPAGTYREAVTDLSIVALTKATQCTLCPFGRYRSTNKGKSADECSKCPIGKFANVEGSIQVSDCQRCPAGTTAEEEGMRLCTCITEDSCDLEVLGQTFFSNDVDFYRESLPFIGRW